MSLQIIRIHIQHTMNPSSFRRGAGGEATKQVSQEMAQGVPHLFGVWHTSGKRTLKK